MCVDTCKYKEGEWRCLRRRVRGLDRLRAVFDLDVLDGLDLPVARVEVVLLVDDVAPVVPRIRPQILVWLPHLSNQGNFDCLQQFLTGKSVPGAESEQAHVDAVF